MRPPSFMRWSIWPQHRALRRLAQIRQETDMDERTRTLRNVCEPIGANVYFAPEAHQRYVALGLQAMGSGYFCSRSASMGKPIGLVVTAAFGVFNPTIVVPAIEAGWAATEPEPLLQA